MQREQLLSLLDQQARDAFEGAKQIALSNGGLLSPLHILVGVLQSQGLEKSATELAPLLQLTREAIAVRYPEASDSITVSRETQATISDAGQLAQLDGRARATPAHLLRA